MSFNPDDYPLVDGVFDEITTPFNPPTFRTPWPLSYYVSSSDGSESTNRYNVQAFKKDYPQLFEEARHSLLYVPSTGEYKRSNLSDRVIYRRAIEHLKAEKGSTLYNDPSVGNNKRSIHERDPALYDRSRPALDGMREMHSIASNTITDPTSVDYRFARDESGSMRKALADPSIANHINSYLGNLGGRKSRRRRTGRKSRRRRTGRKSRK
jgi:hypothetical protein